MRVQISSHSTYEIDANPRNLLAYADAARPDFFTVAIFRVFAMYTVIPAFERKEGLICIVRVKSVL